MKHLQAEELKSQKQKTRPTVPQYTKKTIQKARKEKKKDSRNYGQE